MFGLLPTRIHGFLDYLMGVALVVVPLAREFGPGPQTWLPVLLGAGAIIYSLLTDYELGVIPLISMPAHLTLDALGGLAAGPRRPGCSGSRRIHLGPARGLRPGGNLGAAIFTQDAAVAHFGRSRRAGLGLPPLVRVAGHDLQSPASLDRGPR